VLLIKKILSNFLKVINKICFVLIFALLLFDSKLLIKSKHQETLNPITTLDSIIITMHRLKCPSEYVAPYSLAIHGNCNLLKLDWKYIVAKIYCESNFDPSIKSFVATKLKGDKEKEFAVGLMQLKPSTAASVASELGDNFSYEKLFDGVTNIKWGTYYFSQRLIRYYYDYEKAVRAYNLGDKGLRDSIERSDNHWDRVSNVYKSIGE